MATPRPKSTATPYPTTVPEPSFVPKATPYPAGDPELYSAIWRGSIEQLQALVNE